MIDDTGEQRCLLFLPGAGASPRFWRPLGERLPETFEKIYLGWPGLGHEPPDPAVSGLDDLIALVESRLGPDPVDLIAQSMGGYIALQVALRNPRRIRRIVLSVTSGGVDVAGLGGADWRTDYRREFPKAAAWVCAPTPDLAPRLVRLPQPVLLLWGDADPISPVAVGERLQALLPDARLHVVAGGEHDVAATHAEHLAPLVQAHLA